MMINIENMVNQACKTMDKNQNIGYDYVLKEFIQNLKVLHKNGDGEEVLDAFFELYVFSERNAKMDFEEIFKNSARIQLDSLILQYLRACVEGDGSKADIHIAICEFYTAAALGFSQETDVASRGDRPLNLFWRIHDESQELTGNLDEKIGLPLERKSQVNYNRFISKFFNNFHEIAINVIAKEADASFGLRNL